MDLLQGQLSEGLVDQLTNQIGTGNQEQTATAASGIINTLMGALAKNASTPDGANALSNALDRDHDGSILDDVMGFLGGNVTPQNTSTTNGQGILNHILGDRQNGAFDMISKMTGLDSSKIGQMAITLAPVLMGLLGKQKRQANLDSNGILDLLNNTVNQQRTQSNPLMDMATRFLDADGDGSVMDDLMGGIGKNLLSNLFGGKR
jgi:hypothetical protein